ncbi:metal ABC transporter ATP-binding protein [Clostridium estertheticum]|uniref:Metal ABC transporter ATP-binding protein n=1 Tax=Clostridium estertheticum TaxID=238834 RepID=A0AA47EKM5_9CLOT|nr:metal ABC transporter ATP-binding protein [Clostridium estertheticum]MBU3155289.1 metal ABC transporter ATP-binding protein [Clostridium estertheticum]MBU3197775.1 metal ABC transporter ATP-binding protein [Clostridium estertheticum]WAG60348.1 metal ABC transporter ATP-binding protein [Clostridium estertheticum]WAG65576.1 metal ABC transporter ATP-binding protein [Clostridium estertheticum]
MINIKNLCFTYTNSKPYILDNVNVKIEKGSYVSILGENGSAKSTLLKLILNLLKPNSGEIIIDTSRIAYVAQKVENFNAQFPITVYEMLNCHRRVLKLKDKSLISKSLKAVGMEDHTHTLIGNLSGGQQQKIFIARSLIGNPELLILDEPSTGIDIQSMEDIYGIIKGLNVNLGITVVSVEHNLKAALDNSTDIFEMSNRSGILYTINDYKYKITQERG